jgi:hypothetical protein
MAAPKKPRKAPTMMNTVPSGRLDFVMKGAFLVGGTVGSGYCPARVGRSFGRPSAEEPPVIVGTSAFVVVDEPEEVGVMTAVVLEGDDDPEEVFVSDLESDLESVLESGLEGWSVLPSDLLSDVVAAALDPPVVVGRLWPVVAGVRSAVVEGASPVGACAALLVAGDPLKAGRF